MPIKTACSCGKSLSVNDQLAGKRVKCPACGAALLIPNAVATGIPVACKCGKSFRAKPELAGRQVPCPACQQPLLIPESGIAPAGPAPSADPLAAPLPQTGAPQPSPHHGNEAQSSGASIPLIDRITSLPVSRTTWILTGAAAGAAILLIAFAVRFFTGKDTQEVQNTKFLKLKTKKETQTSYNSGHVQRRRNGIETVSNSLGMKLNLLPAGEFYRSRTKVKLTKPFYLGVYEVTQQQFEKLMGRNPTKFKDPQNPVGGVSWDDANAFCKELSELPEEKFLGRTYRLPTEMEWEYAARADATTSYSFGDSQEELREYAWFGDNSGDKLLPPDSDIRLDSEKWEQWTKTANLRLHRVGLKKPNRWGLYDMEGNVCEWSSSFHQDGYYINKKSIKDDPGPSTGQKHINKGGSYLSPAPACWPSSYGVLKSTDIFSLVGFRVAMSIRPIGVLPRSNREKTSRPDSQWLMYFANGKWLVSDIAGKRTRPVSNHQMPEAAKTKLTPYKTTVVVLAGGAESSAFRPVTRSGISISADGKVIAFVNEDHKLVVMPFNDGSARRVIVGSERVSKPVVSPDGTKVAYVVGSDLHVIGANGSDQIQLTRTGNVKGLAQGAWSSDGNAIAFSAILNRKEIVFTVNVDGSGLKQVLTGSAASWVHVDEHGIHPRVYLGSK